MRFKILVIEVIVCGALFPNPSIGILLLNYRQCVVRNHTVVWWDLAVRDRLLTIIRMT